MKNFKQLIQTIEHVHQHLQRHAANAVNQALTIRNWLIGYYIVEFELKGKDRANYGEALIDTLANKLDAIKGIDRRSLFRFRNFYLTYTHLSDYLIHTNIFHKLDEASALSETVGTLPPLSQQHPIVGTVSPQSEQTPKVPSELIITKLPYSHIELILKIDDLLKRTFYEIECIKATWSVRELKRQITSLCYERSGLSKKPENLTTILQLQTTPQQPIDVIKNIYAFDFLNINTQDIVEESDLEKALLDNLQEFIIEFGHGFCFEARQKRILIGEKYYFIDLVFYHRILKFHILLELKMGEFEHGDIGQLNTYLNYYKQEISEAHDNLPVGILLVADKDHALVKYATAGMDKNLFIQQYLVNLPDTKQLETYINNQLEKLQ